MGYFLSFENVELLQGISDSVLILFYKCHYTFLIR
jgi:hypothetical protein